MGSRYGLARGGGEDMRNKPNLANRLPIREDVTEVQRHRPPSKSEVRRGYGATHWGTFRVEEVCYPGTRIAKAWFKDRWGVRWYK